MKHFKVGAILFLALCVIIVIAQNTTSVETQLLFLRVTMPRAVLLLVTLAVGFILGAVCTLMMQRRRNRAGATTT